MQYDFDVVVIGGGPGGYVAAIQAARLGKKSCLVEKDALGGVCLNRGCVPTKTMIKSVNVLSAVKAAETFGVKGVNAARCHINLDRLQQRKKEVVERLTAGVAYLLKANGVEIIRGEGTFTGKHSIAVGERTISGEHIIIATGSSPLIPPIPTDGGIRLMVSDDVLELTEVPEQMVIVGAGVVGIEFAYIYSGMGARVTVIELMEQILPTVDDEIARTVRAFLEDRGVAIHMGAKVTEFTRGSVCFEQAGVIESVKTDTVLLATGRKPNIDGLNLEAAGVPISKNGIPVNSRMQTGADNIYAIGDVNGMSMLAHVASMEGIIAVENICGNPMRIDYGKVPQCIYIAPEIASVGMTEQEAIDEGLDIEVGRFSYSGNGKAIIEGEETGFVKAIIDRELGEIIGVHMIGAHATEMIGELALAMKMEGTVEELIHTVHPHPSISEVIPEAVQAAWSKIR